MSLLNALAFDSRSPSHTSSHVIGRGPCHGAEGLRECRGAASRRGGVARVGPGGRRFDLWRNGGLGRFEGHQHEQIVLWGAVLQRSHWFLGYIGREGHAPNVLWCRFL